jgi:diguanylate cyclase (GGDEF)-like protein
MSDLTFPAVDLTRAEPIDVGNAFTPLDGVLAASLERVARLAATVLHAPAAFIALLGEDRRCFGGGRALPPWFSHDPGILVRSGLCARVVEAGGVLAVPNTSAPNSAGTSEVAVDLGIASYVAAPLSASNGRTLGIFCVIDQVPRWWTQDELGVLTDIAATAASEVELRRRIIEREQIEQQLRHASRHDPLTGLPNRTFFTERLSQALRRSSREPADLFAVLFLDLDHFKVVNDSVGHYVGDELLIAVARRLEQCLRGGDMVARLGGDEFALLLERVGDARDAARVAERVQSSLSVPFNIGSYELPTSASIGIVLSSSARESPELLLRSADMAMHRAKTSGRARFELFDPAMHAAALARLRLETDLRRAQESGEFVVYYQPVVSLETGRITGVEALVRWQHPERGLVLPGEFVPAAEETGLILPLGRWVLDEACRQMRAWRGLFEQLDSLSVAVNLSGKQLSQPDLVDQVSRILHEHALAPSSLKLEITESAIIEKSERTTRVLSEIKRLGVQIYLDDFGTGYSSLGYLHRLPIDALKVDRSFISRMEAADQPLQLVRTILALSRNLGLDAIAEGVTTVEQLRRLRALGCRFAQGYLFSAPLDPGSMTTLLERNPRW